MSALNTAAHVQVRTRGEESPEATSGERKPSKAANSIVLLSVALMVIGCIVIILAVFSTAKYNSFFIIIGAGVSAVGVLMLCCSMVSNNVSFLPEPDPEFLARHNYITNNSPQQAAATNSTNQLGDNDSAQQTFLQVGDNTNRRNSRSMQDVSYTNHRRNESLQPFLHDYHMDSSNHGLHADGPPSYDQISSLGIHVSQNRRLNVSAPVLNEVRRETEGVSTHSSETANQESEPPPAYDVVLNNPSMFVNSSALK